MIKTLFKAEPPFMEVKHGHGYQGVIMYDDINDKVQCHICGLWYENMGKHAQMKHKVNADAYKMEYGLTLGTPLCSIGYSTKKREATNKCIAAGTIKQDIAVRGAKYNRTRRRVYRQVGVKTQQFYNRNGLCDLQIKTRYQIVKNIVGKEPTQNEIIKYDRKLFFCGIVPRFKNLNNFKKEIGCETRKQGEAPNKIETIDLIASLRKFANENKKIPNVTDFMPRHKAFYRAFGSWSNALRTAGLK